MNEIRPRLTTEWIDLIGRVRELGVQEALRRIDTYLAGKIVFDEKNNTSTINASRILTEQDLMIACGVDQEEWLVDTKVLNKWEVGAKGPDGKIVVEPLYQVKLWLKRRGFKAPDDYWTQKWIDRLTKDTKVYPFKKELPNADPINIVVADIHLGRFSNENFGVYNVEVARERLKTIAKIANTHNRPVNIFMLGDVIESFTGKNKPNTWKQIEMYGAQVALSAYDLLEEFFASIENFNQCYFVGGNHDRITDGKEDDDRGQVLELINGFFQRKNRFRTVFDPTIQTVDVGNVRYILTHGDKKITKMTGSDFVLRYGDTSKFTCILSAHLHHKQLVEEDSRFTKRIVPPIASGSEYEYISGWNSNPGFLIVSEYNERVKFEEYPL